MIEDTLPGHLLVQRLVVILDVSLQMVRHICGATTILDLTSLLLPSIKAELAMDKAFVNICT